MENDNDDAGDDLFGFVGTDGINEINGATDLGLDEAGGIFAGPSKDAVIFCIDCGDMDNLFKGGSGSLFYDAVTTFHSFMRGKVVSSDGSDMTGLIFYNVSISENVLVQRGVYVVQDIGLISARRIQEIRSIRDLSLSEFQLKFGTSSSECGVSDLLFVCNSMFKKTTASFRPRMFIFTPNDDPCGTDRRARKAALTRANDFHEGMSTGAEINLIPLLHAGKENFNVEIFWNKVILLSANDDDESSFVDNSLIQLAEMKQIVLRKIFRKRALNRVNFFLDNDTKIALMIYTSVMPAGRPKQIYVDPTTFVPLRTETKFYSEFTGAVLDPSAGEVRTYIDFEGQKILFSKEDILEIKTFIKDSKITGNLTLVGFKSIDKFLQPYYSIGHSCFLYPQDSRVEGSSLVSSALIDRMLERRVVAVCRFVAKANSPLLFAALIPQKESEGKSPGFHLVRLPWAEDIRDLTLPGTNVAQSCQGPELTAIRDTQVQAAKEVIASMTETNWEPEVLDNPALTQTYIMLESMALNLDASEVGKVVDLVGPDPKKIETTNNNAIPNWLASLSIPDTLACELGAPGVPKKVKYEKFKPDFKTEPLTYTESTVRGLIANDSLKFETVEILKEIIRTLLPNITPAGRKPELLEKITHNLSPKI